MTAATEAGSDDAGVEFKMGWRRELLRSGGGARKRKRRVQEEGKGRKQLPMGIGRWVCRLTREKKTTGRDGT